MSTSGNLASEERLNWIGEQLRKHGRIEITAAAKLLDVSEMTIRRDMRELEERGELRRVRGGALGIGPVHFADRHRIQSKAKGIIAGKLLPLMPKIGAVSFDASSTIMRLASILDESRDLVVVTNGPDTFQALHTRAGLNPILSGGELETRTGSLVGALACRAVGQFSTLKFFASAAGVDRTTGSTEVSVEEAEVKRAMAAKADEVILAVDSTKLGVHAVALGVEWEHVSVLVTELDPRHKLLAPYRQFTRVR